MRTLESFGDVGPDILFAVSMHCSHIRHLDLSIVNREDLEGLNV